MIAPIVILPLFETWVFWLFFADKIVFMLYFISVCYLLIFAIGSTLKRRSTYHGKTRREHKMAILFFLPSQQRELFESINSMFTQEYPADKYDLIVMRNTPMEEMDGELQAMGVRLVTTSSERNNKALAIKEFMMSEMANDYDVVLIMDVGNSAQTTFLAEINRAYHSGATAIQTHRMAKHMESDTAIFSALSEEINNSIFRLGHVNFGFSSALSGSGMAFKAAWLRKNAPNFNHTDIEKQLEKMLLEQFFFINYLNDVPHYTEKVAKVDEYYSQRSAWLTSQSASLKELIVQLPRAALRGNYDYADKLLQWLIPSRTILIGTLVMISSILLFISWTMAIKWVAMMFMLITAFSIALPDYLIDARFVKALRSAPLLFTVTLFNSIRNKLLSLFGKTR